MSLEVFILMEWGHFNEAEMLKIMKDVYSKQPLPTGYGF